MTNNFFAIFFSYSNIKPRLLSTSFSSTFAASQMCPTSLAFLRLLVLTLPIAQLHWWLVLVGPFTMRPEPSDHNPSYVLAETASRFKARASSGTVFTYLVMKLPCGASFFRDSASFIRRARLAFTPDDAILCRTCFAMISI